MKKRITSFFVALCLLLTMIPTMAFAADGNGISVDKAIVANGETFTVTLDIPAISAPLSNIEFNIAFDNTAFEVTEYTKPLFATMSNTVSEANTASKLTCSNSSATGENDLTALQSGGTLTATFKVKDDAVAGSYTFEVTKYTVNSLNETTYATESHEPAGVTKSAIVTIGSSTPEVTAPYTANISTTTTTLTEDQTLSVNVNVGGTTGSFASAEVTLTYDPDFMTFDESASTLNEAGVDTSVAGTIKLVDHGESQNNGVAYTLVFKGLKETNPTTAVTLTDAKFSTAEAAVGNDLTPATGENALTLTITKAALNVTLGNMFHGNNTVPYGADYTFTSNKGENAKYYTYTFLATMGGNAVDVVPVTDGSWKIENVTGDLVINATETPKSFGVSTENDSTITAPATEKITFISGVTDNMAQYATAVVFDVPAPVEKNGTTDGYHYVATVTIGEAAYTPSVSGQRYTIDGSAVKGAIVIKLSKVTDPADSVMIKINDSNEIYYNDEAVTEITAPKNSTVTLELKKETGYDYTVKVNGEEVELDTNNEFTVPTGTADVQITVDKALDKQYVKVQTYLTLSGTNMHLVTIKGNGDQEITGKTYQYQIDNQVENMFWSSKYQAYCYLVVANTLSVEDAKTAIVKLVNETAASVAYNKDVNGTGTVDANDAQLVYNMYSTKAYDKFDTVDMIKFLKADLNSSVGIDMTDATVIINYLTNKQEG